MTLSEELNWRGFVNQTTLADLGELDDKKFAFYWGVDPSASSMTIGNLAAAMMVRLFIKHGHDAYLLIGGATGIIGDPDGKKEERQLLTIDDIESNKQTITSQYKQVFDGMDFTVVDNYDWFKQINYINFLRDVGKHFSMTQLLDREFVKARIGEGGSGISYAEFSYSLIQGYDFLHLYREHGVTMQVCGADQWGNSLAGVELIRKLEDAKAHVYSAPLIIDKSSGKKFGKSEGNAVWLDPELTSPYAFYQFWLNVGDEEVGSHIKTYTEINPKQYDALMNEFSDTPQQRAAQKFLAYHVTKLVHGEKIAESVRSISQVLFDDDDFSSLDAGKVKELAKEIPSAKAKSLVELLSEAELVSSNSEARRAIDSRAVSVNEEKATANINATEARFTSGNALVKYGKNKFAIWRKP